MKKGLREILVIEMKDFFKWKDFSKNLSIVNAYAYTPIYSKGLYSFLMMLPFVFVLSFFGNKIKISKSISEESLFFIFIALFSLYCYLLFKSATNGNLKYAGIIKQKSVLLHKVTILYLLIFYS